MGERKKDALRVNFDRVAQDASSETDKDWCQSGETFEICDISDGRGDGFEIIVP